MSGPSIDLLIEFTHDEDARARAAAVAGLAKIGDARGFAPVLVAMFDPADEVRMAAATSLGIFADDRALEPLIQTLDEPNVNDMLAVTCAWALGQLPSTKAFDTLLELMRNAERENAVRAAAANALGERAETAGSDLATTDSLIERARAALLETVSDECADIRSTAMWTLGHLPPDEASIAAARIMTEDEDEWCVRYAREALEQFSYRP